MTARPRTTPAPLLLAAVLVALEGLVLLAYAVLEIANLSSDRAAVAVTTTLFFAAYGGGLVAAALALTRGRSWARSPVVLAQLIQLGVAWSFRGGSTTTVAVVIAAVAAVVLVAMFAPASIAALEQGRDEGDGAPG